MASVGVPGQGGGGRGADRRSQAGRARCLLGTRVQGACSWRVVPVRSQRLAEQLGHGQAVKGL